MNSQRLEIEEALVAALILQPRDLLVNAGAINPAYFSEPRLRRVIVAMYELALKGEELSMANLSTVSQTDGTWLVEITMRIGIGFGSVPILAQRLTEFAILDIGESLRRKISKPEDAFSVVAEIDKAHIQIQRMVDAHATKPKAALLSDYRTHITDTRDGKMRRVKTGIPTLDAWSRGGLPLGDMTLIGGSPGAGKTSFGLGLAIGTAANGITTAYIQGEMPVQQILERAQGITTGRDIDLIARGQVMDEVESFIESFMFMPLEIQNTFDRNISQLMARCAEAIDRGAELLLIDYLQVFIPKGDPKTEFSQIKALSEAIRGSALKRNVHYVVFSSLNRVEVMSKRPTLHSLYGGSQLEHDCAIGIILHSDKDGPDRIDDITRRVHVFVDKLRNGRTGEFTMLYNLPSQKMQEEALTDYRSVPERYEREAEPF